MALNKGSRGDADAASEKEAAAAYDEAQAALQEAADRAAEAGQGLAAARMRNVPDMRVRVLDGQTVSYDGKTYYGKGYSLAPEDLKENHTLTLPGPDALALTALGHVQIEGAAE